MTGRYPPERVREALRKAERRLVGKSEKARAKRLTGDREARLADLGFVGLSFATKRVGGEDTGRPALRLIVRKKLTAQGLAAAGIEPLPASIGGIATDVVEAGAVSSSPAMGGESKHAISSELGTVTLVRTIGGASCAISCSHVLAPAAVYPARGDPCVFDGAEYEKSLLAWNPLTALGKVSADVAVARVPGAAETTAWPDGIAVADQCAYDPGCGPFTLFGRQGRVTAATGGPLSRVGLEVPDVGTVFYEGHFLLDAPILGGDSGAPVRDAQMRLVGMVVGGDGATGGAWCTPWPAVEAMLEGLNVRGSSARRP